MKVYTIALSNCVELHELTLYLSKTEAEKALEQAKEISKNKTKALNIYYRVHEYRL